MPHTATQSRKGSIRAALGCLSCQTERALNLLMVLALVAMITLVFTNVVLRYGFNSGISVSVELSRFLFVWVTFIGTVVGLMRHEHLSVTTFSDRLPASLQALLGRLVTLVMLGCCLMLVKGSYAQTLLNWSNLSPISGVPVGVFYLAGLIAGVLMSILLVFRLLAPRHLQRQPRSQDRAQEVSS
ncbi:TRAP transporter small permease [Halomonas binhaiensis]|uniref:TRAP transporter small permease protein n=1 Tax=Halomonas binhaiensis TaxID=2562282 RepID=A0A856QVS5_9GAMM|nr:TRAP transporter small permease [Halomonas binhaiensis]QEM84093.2 TRAP transporter small permease [Halomonas binhaiensis]